MSTVPRVAASTLRESFALQPDLFEAFWDLLMGFAKMLITLGLEPIEMPITVVATPGSERSKS